MPRDTDPPEDILRRAPRDRPSHTNSEIEDLIRTNAKKAAAEYDERTRRGEQRRVLESERLAVARDTKAMVDRHEGQISDLYSRDAWSVDARKRLEVDVEQNAMKIDQIEDTLANERAKMLGMLMVIKWIAVAAGPVFALVSWLLNHVPFGRPL